MAEEAQMETEKAEEPKTETADEVKAPEPAKELEEDAKADKRKKLEAGVVQVDMDSATVNVMPSCGGKILMTLGDGGLQYFCGAARTNTGLKSGRYLFEVKIVESRTTQSGRRPGGPKLSIGIASAGTNLLLGENASSISFDSEGHLVQGKWKTKTVKPFKNHDVLALLVNLDLKSPNARTISLFCNGIRASEPQPIPEALHDKPVFPTVNFKNMTLHVNFGPDTLAPLPFTCRTLQEAAKDDVAVVAAPAGKKEVILPVGLPDEGTFPFIDLFLEENPNYTELSDRNILRWAKACDVWPKTSYSYSKDKPGLDFGMREMDEATLRRTLSTASSYYDRGYLVAEVKNNLLAEERKKCLAQYDGEKYKKIAVVAMGEPPDSFKKRVHDELLHEKKWNVITEVKKKYALEEKKRSMAKAKAAREVAAKEQEASAKEKEARPDDAEKKDEEKKEEKKDVVEIVDDSKNDVVEIDEEKKEEEKKDQEKKDEEVQEDEKKDEEPLEMDETLEEAIKKAQDAIELTDEEKSLWFPKDEKTTDLTPKEISAHFADFSIPTKAEGFDEVRFVWGKQSISEEYLQSWIKDRKLTQRIEDLYPGTWFKEQWVEWQRLYEAWRSRQNEWKDSSRRGRAPKRALAEVAKKEDGAEADEDGKSDAQEKDEPMAPADEEEIIAEDIDPFECEDVSNLGNDEPLFAHFAYEDWTLLSLRFELHLLVHAFAVDVDDPERAIIHESHVGFYFKKYFKKDFNPKFFNCNTLPELLELIPDIVELSSNSTLGPLLSDDSPMDNFIRLTEDSRRERQKLIDGGDEKAVLRFTTQRPFQYENKGGYKDRRHDKGDKGKGRQGFGVRVAVPEQRVPATTTGRAYGAPLPGRATYGQGPPPPAVYGHGPPPVYGGGHYPPPPGYAHAPPTSRAGYGAPPPVYGAPPPPYGAPPPPYGHSPYGKDPGYGKGDKRGYGPPPPGALPPSKHSRKGDYADPGKGFQDPYGKGGYGQPRDDRRDDRRYGGDRGDRGGYGRR